MMRMWWRLSVLGLLGVASMLLMPMEQLLPAEIEIDPMLLRLVAIVQPALLVLAAGRGKGGRGCS